MRSIQQVAELSYDSFKETFGSVSRHQPTPPSQSAENRSKNGDEPEHTSHSSSRSDLLHVKVVYDEVQNNRHQSPRKNSLFSISSNESTVDSLASKRSPMNEKRRRFRKISMDRFSSIGGTVQAVFSSRRTKNSTSDSSETDGRHDTNGTPNFPSHIAQRLASESGSISSEDADDSSSSRSSSRGGASNPKPAIFRIPATRLASASHRGFLDCRNKKKQWKRFWCVLQDACLYCYHTPQSDTTRDAILLRGYDVNADVTNLKRSRFAFRLQQKGVSTLHFSTDNHRDFLLWVATLEKETRCVSATENKRRLSTCEAPRLNLPDSEVKKYHRASMPNLAKFNTVSTSPSKQLARNGSQERKDRELANMQKNKLLQEIADQQQLLQEEQQLLDKLPSGGARESVSSSDSVISRDDVIRQYERAKNEEEIKAMKFTTFLNRRRNSVQLKVDQYARDLAPRNGRRRLDDPAQFFAMETKLKELQEELSRVDREFLEEEAKKQHNLDKLEYKRDLELMIVEQREAIEILRRHQTGGMSHRFRRRRSHSDILMTPSSTRSNDTLTSIDELSSVSDEHVTSSAGSSLSDAASATHSQRLNLQGSPRAQNHSLRHQPSASSRSKSEPCSRRFSAEVSSDGDSGFQPYNCVDDLESAHYWEERNLRPSIDSEVEFDIGSDNCDDVYPVAPSSRDSTLKSASAHDAAEAIDASILAKIEDFELFAKLKLEEFSKS
ncbi:uncharacterized protein LOC143446557 [Clavelina lepadiformis]|uniref:uncharacterized protein LOC143446557 n=1 Tax=Clavelina lepadiformis TaxID=159417 RepID=UPI00404221F3